MVPQALVSRLPGIGLVALQSQGFQNSLDDARETARRTGQPYDEKKAYVYALTNSFQQALLEKVGFDAALGKWIEKGGAVGLNAVLQRVAAGAVGDGITEPTQGAIQDALATTFGIEERNPFDPRRRGMEAALGSILGGGMSALKTGSDRIEQTRQAPAQQPPAPGAKYDPEKHGQYKTFIDLPPPSSGEKATQPPVQPPSDSGATPAPPPTAGNAAALSLLNEERAELIGQLSKTAPKTAAGRILSERLLEIDALIGKFGTQGNQPEFRGQADVAVQPASPPSEESPPLQLGDPDEAPENALPAPEQEARTAPALRPPMTPEGKVIPLDESPQSYRYVPVAEGNIEWGNVSEQIAEEAAVPIQAAPIRVQAGFHNADGFGFGWVHAHDHEKGVLKSGWSNMRDFLADTLGDFNQIWLQPNGRLLLVKTADPKQVGVVELQPSKGFYGLTTAYPERKSKDFSTKAKLIWERSEPVSAGAGNPDAPSSPPAPQSSSSATVAQGAPNQLPNSISQSQPQSNPKPTGLRSDVEKNFGKGGFIDPRILGDVIAHARSLYFRGIRYVDWSRRMIRDLGEKITPHLRRIWQAMAEAADPESKLRARMAEWKRQGAQASIREEAATQALRAKLARTPKGDFLENSVFREIANHGRQVLSRDMDYLDWSMRMIRDLGPKVTSQLPHAWRAIRATEGTGVSFRSATSPRTADSRPQSMEGQRPPPGPAGEAASASIGFPDGDADSFRMHQALKAVAREMKLVKDGFGKLGIEIITTSGGDPKIVPDDAGNLAFHFPEQLLVNDEWFSISSGLRPGQLIKLILGEELIHATHFVNLREAWEKSGTSLPFREYVIRSHREIFADLRNTIESAPERERVALTNAIRSSYHAYFSQQRGSPPPKARELDTVFRDLETDPSLTKFIHEFLRQTVQLKRQGEISESVAEKIFAAIQKSLDWLTMAISTIKRELPGAYDGRYGNAVKASLLDIESRLKSIEEDIPLPPRIYPFEK